jgi:DNA-binding NarL/FixJ family response regulator
MTRATLLLADRPATRSRARTALAQEFRISGEADDVEQAIGLAGELQPDVCLIGRDVAGDDLASVREICHVAPACAVVVLSEESDVEDMLAAVRAGAVGYVPGAPDGERLRRIVAAAVNEEAVVPRTMVHELLLELRAGGAGADALTARESQVLGMLRRGQSTAAIAERLQITPVTVRRHISELVRKLGVADRSELINSGARAQGRPRAAGRSTTAGVGQTGS